MVKRRNAKKSNKDIIHIFIKMIIYIYDFWFLLGKSNFFTSTPYPTRAIISEDVIVDSNPEHDIEGKFYYL